MPSVVLEGAAKELLLLHAVAGFAGVGASTHLVIACAQAWRGRVEASRLVRIYATVLGAAFTLTFAVGLLLYPHYRYQVRGLFLDRYAPWASNLFDMKEIIAGLGLPLALTLFFVGRGFDAKDQPELTPFITLIACGVCGVVWASALTGLLVTSVRGV